MTELWDKNKRLVVQGITPSAGGYGVHSEGTYQTGSVWGTLERERNQRERGQ